EAQANEKGLALVADCPEGEAPIDGGRLRQVLDQLVSSAVKRSDRGSVTIHVRRRVEHTGAGWLRVTVADTGGGVTSAARQSLFSDISQAERALGDAGGGSLGLLVSRRIIEEMGGVIGVEPREAGSVFWFEIPLAQAPGPAFAAEPATDTETLADVLQALERRISRDREAPTLIAREASDATGAPRWRIIAADRTLLLIGALSARRIAAACDSMDAHPVAAPADEGAKKLMRGAAA
ncbi:MAG TPA: ATP-binding protein, partial [Beijerinckiaceae bacterium]